eukprot:7582941-Heterocapsa_arctica.AAC.1
MPQLHAAPLRRPCVVQRVAPKPCAANAHKSHTLTVLNVTEKTRTSDDAGVHQVSKRETPGQLQARTAELPRGKKKTPS